MRKSARLLAPFVALALMPMGAMTTPTASAAPCDDGQFWSPHSNACEPLPCPYGASFDSNDDVCQCNIGWRFNQVRNICQAVYMFGPPILDR
jgi:hypothetical protein